MRSTKKYCWVLGEIYRPQSGTRTNRIAPTYFWSTDKITDTNKITLYRLGDKVPLKPTQMIEAME
jgi:hypothetical protein